MDEKANKARRVIPTEYVQTVLRLDGVVVEIHPTAHGTYELVIERPDGKVARPVPERIAQDPLAAPEFHAIVNELKAKSR